MIKQKSWQRSSRLKESIKDLMISFSQVYKRYPNGFDALKNIGFTLEAGEMALITGHSGAGKTTLLRLIAAIERPTSGSIIVNGQNVSALKSGAIPFFRRNLGLVFQDQKILFDRTVFDNVLLPLQISGFSSRAATGRVRAALDKVGLLDREKARPLRSPAVSSNACALPAQ